MMFQGSKHVPGDTHFRLARRRRRQRHQRHHRLRSHQLLRDRAGRTSSSSRCGSSPIAWATCSTRSIRPTSRTSRTSSATSAGRASRTSRTASSKRRCSTSCSRRTHPYYASVIGSHADIQAAKLDDVKNFFKLYYAPNNASLAIVGDIDKAATKTLVEKYFGTLKQGKPVPKPYGADAADHGRAPRRRAGSRRAAARLHGVADARRSSSRATPTPTSRRPCSAAGGRAACTRSSSTRSRSRRTSSAQQYSLMLGSVFQITATARPGTHGRGAREGDRRGAGAVPRDRPGCRPKSSARATSSRRASSRASRTLGGFGGVADRLNSYNHYLGDPGYLAEGHPALSRRRRRRRSRRSRSSSSRRARASSSTACPAQPDLGAPVPTPKVAQAPPGTGAESINADEAWRKEPPKAGRGARRCSCRRRRRSSCRTA